MGALHATKAATYPATMMYSDVLGCPESPYIIRVGTKPMKYRSMKPKSDALLHNVLIVGSRRTAQKMLSAIFRASGRKYIDVSVAFAGDTP
jgi:hypothetical protein